MSRRLPTTKTLSSKRKVPRIQAHANCRNHRLREAWVKAWVNLEMAGAQDVKPTGCLKPSRTCMMSRISSSRSHAETTTKFIVLVDFPYRRLAAKWRTRSHPH